MDNQNNNVDNTPQTSVSQPQVTVPIPQANPNDIQTSVPTPNDTTEVPSITPSTNAFGPSPNMVPSTNISAPQVEAKPQVQTNNNKRKVQGIFNVDELLKESSPFESSFI